MRGLPLPKPLPGCFSAVIEMHHDFFRAIFGVLFRGSFLDFFFDLAVPVLVLWMGLVRPGFGLAGAWF